MPLRRWYRLNRLIKLTAFRCIEKPPYDFRGLARVNKAHVKGDKEKQITMTNLGSGILQLAKNGGGHLINPAKLTERIWVPGRLIRDYHLPQGATVTGQVRSSQEGCQLETVEAVCGLSPEAFQQRIPFKRVIAIDLSRPVAEERLTPPSSSHNTRHSIRSGSNSTPDYLVQCTR